MCPLFTACSIHCSDTYSWGKLTDVWPCESSLSTPSYVKNPRNAPRFESIKDASYTCWLPSGVCFRSCYDFTSVYKLLFPMDQVLYQIFLCSYAVRKFISCRVFLQGKSSIVITHRHPFLYRRWDRVPRNKQSVCTKAKHTNLTTRTSIFTKSLIFALFRQRQFHVGKGTGN